MNTLRFLPLIALFLTLASCSSVQVTSDYDKEKDFNQYHTFAFYKKGIDKLEISDLDKRRIMRAIEAELKAKGMTISDDPDLLVNIFTKTKSRIDVYDSGYYGWYPWYYYGYGYGFGWGPGYTNVVESTEGTLFIDLIDAKAKELVWQGMGTSVLSKSKTVDEKEAKIREIVSQIMQLYPPQPEETKKK